MPSWLFAAAPGGTALLGDPVRRARVMAIKLKTLLDAAKRLGGRLLASRSQAPKCRGCGNPIDASNDSEAHIIPKALGGRLAPKKIICRTCNTELDRLADHALIKAFGDWPTLLNIPRQGENPPKILDTRDGHRVRLTADGSMTKIDVQYDVQVTPEGHQVVIGAGDMRTLRQLLNRAAKDFPQFDPKQAEQYAKVVGVQGDDELNMSLDFSPQAVFGGLITAIWLFLIMKTGHVFMNWDRLLKCIKKMQTHGGTFRYLTDGLPGLNGPELTLNHKIIVRSVPITGNLIAYVELLGVLKIGGVFAKASAPSIAMEHIYVYDLVSRSDRSSEFSIKSQEFEVVDWNNAGHGQNELEFLVTHFRNAQEMLVKYYQDRFKAPPQSATETPSA